MAKVSWVPGATSAKKLAKKNSKVQWVGSPPTKEQRAEKLKAAAEAEKLTWLSGKKRTTNCIDLPAAYMIDYDWMKTLKQGSLWTVNEYFVVEANDARHRYRYPLIFEKALNGRLNTVPGFFTFLGIGVELMHILHTDTPAEINFPLFMSSEGKQFSIPQPFSGLTLIG